MRTILPLIVAFCFLFPIPLVCAEDQVLHLPQQITVIEEETFLGNSIIQHLDLPEGLQTIRKRAFANCPNLNSVILPNGLFSLETEAFDGCVNLKSITVPNTLTRIDENAFHGCSEELIIYGDSNTYAEEYCDKRNIHYLDPQKINTYPYIVSFYCENELLNTKSYTYGDRLIIPSLNPAKNSDFSYTYEFSGWSNSSGTVHSLPFLVKKDEVFHACFNSIPIEYSIRLFPRYNTYGYYLSIPSAWISKIPEQTSNQIKEIHYSGPFTIVLGFDSQKYTNMSYEYTMILKNKLKNNYEDTGSIDINGYNAFYGITYNEILDTYSVKYIFNLGYFNHYYIEANNMTPEQYEWFKYISLTFLNISEEEYLSQQTSNSQF